MVQTEVVVILDVLLASGVGGFGGDGGVGGGGGVGSER